MTRAIFLLPLLGACALLADPIQDSVPAVDIEVDLIDQGETPGTLVSDTAFGVALTESEPTVTIGSDETGGFGPVLYFDSVVREGGSPGFLDLAVSDLTLTATTPVSLQLELVADGDGKILGEGPESGTPVAPANCTMTLDPADLDEAAHADDVLGCMRSWADDNGVPAELGFTFTMSARTAGFGYSATYTMSTTQHVEIDCEFGVALPDSVLEDAADMDVSNMVIAGYGGAFGHGLDMLGLVNVYDANNIRATSASYNQRIEAGTAYYVGQEVEVVEDAAQTLQFQTNVVTLEYDPVDPADWTVATFESMVGDGPGAAGSADACWVELHDDVPNSGLVRWFLLGSGEIIY